MASILTWYVRREARKIKDGAIGLHLSALDEGTVPNIYGTTAKDTQAAIERLIARRRKEDEAKKGGRAE